MNLDWQIQTAPWALIAAALFLAASVWFFFRSLRVEGRGRWVTALHFLRLFIAVMTAVTLLRPERVITTKQTEQPRVAILWDASGSMATNDVTAENHETLTRAEWLRRQVEAKFWQPLEKQYKVSVSSFSEIPSDPKVAADMELGTDLYTPLAEALKQHTDLRAVLLLTDGDWNKGKSPITAATALAQRDIPIFSVGIGSEEYLPDLDLQSVQAPAYGLVNERMGVMFTVQNHLSREVRTTVTMEGPGGVHVDKKIVLPPMAQFQDVIVFSPQTIGEGDYVLRVPVEQEEVFATNNERNFHLSVRKESLKVLLVDSQPRWEYRYLRNALLRDPGVEVKMVLFHPEIGMGEGAGYLPAFPATKEELQGYDVIFLGDIGVGAGMLSRENAEMINGLVQKQASGLVLLPGPMGREKSLLDSPLGELFPVEMDFSKGSGFASAREARMDLTLRGRDHWLTMLAGDPDANQSVWRGLPGFFWYAPVVKVRPGSEVLAVHESARNSFGRIPLLVTRTAGSGKVLFMGTDAAWRWRKGVEDTYHYRFWGQVVRWMAHDRHIAQDEGMRFFYSPETPKRGDTVRLNAAVVDRIGLPVSKKNVTVMLTAPSGAAETVELEAGTGEWGAYTGHFTPKEGGRYAVEVTAEGTGRSLKTEINVTVPTLEKEGLPSRPSILREISGLTSGKYGSTNDIDQIIASINLLPERKLEERRFRLWCDPWWCAALLSLLALYWAGRKFAGLV